MTASVCAITLGHATSFNRDSEPITFLSRIAAVVSPLARISCPLCPIIHGDASLKVNPDTRSFVVSVTDIVDHDHPPASATGRGWKRCPSDGAAILSTACFLLTILWKLLCHWTPDSIDVAREPILRAREKVVGSRIQGRP